jgi:hypothetical protein
MYMYTVNVDKVHSEWPDIAYLTPGCPMSIAPVHQFYVIDNILNMWMNSKVNTSEV